MPPRLKALLLLALTLVTTLLRRAFTRRRDGLRAFQENYAADGLSALSAEQRTELPGFSRCIGCGLCDRDEGGRIQASGGAYRGVMEIVLAGSRSMPDFGAAAAALAHVPDAVLAEKEPLCPTAVPFRKLAGFIRDKAATARVSLPVAGSAAPPLRR